MPGLHLAGDLLVAATVGRLLGVDLEAASRQLEREGVGKFVEPFDRLCVTLERRAAEYWD